MALAGVLFKDEERIGRDAVRTGAGAAWSEHHHDLSHGTERLFKPGYVANLVSSWIPALDGVETTLSAGATVADIGCGHGASILVMAAAFPRSTFVGFDYDPESIETARTRAAEQGVTNRVRFEVPAANDFPGAGYAVVTVFDALLDMGDPLSAAEHIHASLAPSGTFLCRLPARWDQVAAGFASGMGPPRCQSWDHLRIHRCRPRNHSAGSPNRRPDGVQGGIGGPDQRGVAALVEG
jgi:SAM-dependent methyltransferase